ncbi:MAG TPA: anti-sigma factor, partial [Acidobacteriaceae bacterium]
LIWGGWVAAVACLFYAIHVRDVNQNIEHRLTIETAQLNQTNASAERAREVVEVLTSPESQRVALVSAHALPEPSGDAVYLKNRGALVFTASHLAPLPPNKTYELWVIPANGSAPVPAGTFQPDAQGMASVLLPNLPKGIPAKAFGVTMENAGGSTTPTLPILLAGG